LKINFLTCSIWQGSFVSLTKNESFLQKYHFPDAAVKQSLK
jgi:hypothetical protein